MKEPEKKSSNGLPFGLDVDYAIVYHGFGSYALLRMVRSKVGTTWIVVDTEDSVSKLLKRVPSGVEVYLPEAITAIITCEEKELSDKSRDQSST